MQRDTFNSAATEEDININFNFGFQVVVEHRKIKGEEQSIDPLGEIVSKMARL
jgi:hypothetical protein